MTPRIGQAMIGWAGLALIVLAGRAVAAPPPYVRLFAPADRIQDWPLEGDQYLPVAAEEFERVADLLERSQRGLATTRRCRIERLSGTARIAEGVLRGHLLLDIAHDGGGPALLPLEPWRLAMADARWETPRASPAVCGLTSGARTAVVVEQSGRLRIDFTLRANILPTGDHEYRLLAPAAVISAWDVSVPDDLNLRASGGMLTRSDTSSDVDYRLDLATGETAALVTTSLAAGAQRRPAMSATRRLHYGFGADGVEVVADFRVTEAAEPRRRIQFAMDEELVPISVVLDQKSLSFRLNVGDDGKRSLDVETAAPLAADQTLRVVAWCPLRAGERWALPQLSLPEFGWSGGTVQLLLSTPLGLTELFPGYGLRQISTSRLTTPLSGEALTFDCYSSAARLELRVDPRAPRILSTSGTTIEVGRRETVARMLCDLRAADGAYFEVHGWIAADWLIEDVTCLTDQRVEEFAIDPADPSRLTVRLNRSVSPRQTARFSVTARRLNPRMAAELDLRSLQPVSWEGEASPTGYFSLRALGEQRWGLQLAEGATIVTRDQLGVAEGELLPAEADEMLVALTRDGTATATLEAGPQRMRATSVAEFVITPDALLEQYVIDCAPSQREVESLLVRFSHPRESAPTWSIANAAGVSVTAAKVGEAEREGADSAETWHVRIWPPQSARFVLQATRKSPWQNTTAMSLVEVPEAAHDEGVARIVADVTLSVATDITGPRPVVAGPALQATEGQSVRGEYRYEPARDVNRVAPPAMTVSIRARPDRELQAIVRSEAVTTTLTALGECLVSARYRLAGDAEATFAVALPQASRVLRLEQDGRSAAFRRVQNEYVVHVAATPPDKELVVEYAIDCGSPLRAGVLDDVLPRPRSTTHPRNWELVLAPAWELVSVASPWECAELSEGDLSARLLGPLSRGSAPRSLDAPLRIRGPAGGSPVLRLRERTAAQRYFCYAAAVAAAACWRLGRRRPIAAVSTSLAIGAIALVAPAALIPWTSGAFIGTILGVLFRGAGHSNVAQTSPLEARSVAPGSTTRTMVVGATRAIVAALALLSVSGQAAEPGVAAARRVYIPVDADGAPTGERYFVSASLWRAMQSQAAAAGDEQPEWLVTSAQYSLGSREKAVDKGARLQVSLELQTFVASANIRLPGAEGEAALWSEALLDGVPWSLEGTDSPAERKFTVADAGHHRLELSCLPEVTELHDHRLYRFAAFQAPRSSLKVWCGAGLPPAEVRSLGQQSYAAANGLMSADIGPSSEIELRTALSADESSARAPVELEQLLWLHVAPERVTAEVRHQIIASDRPIGRLELEFDSRWQAVSASDGRAQVSAVAPGRTILEWSQPAVVGERFTWRCESLDRAGVGEIALPNVTPVGVVVRRRWCAVTFDPSLEMTSLANAGAPSPSAAQFMTSWGPSEHVPLRVVSWPIGGPAPNLQSAFAQSVNVAEELVEATARADRVEMAFEAEVTTAKAALFQHRVWAAPEIAVSGVEVEQDGARRAVSWSRDGEAIHVFLPGATLGRHRLLILASAPMNSSDATRLPLLTLADAELTGRVVRLYRHRSAIVDGLQPEARAVTAAATSPGANAARSAPLGEWALPESGQAISFRVRPNLPRIEALQTSSLFDLQGRLQAEFDCHLSIADGLVDELRIQVADSWRGPFTLEPAWPHELLSDSPPGRTTLLVRPPQPVQGEQRLRIRAAAPAGGASLPEMQLQGADKTQRLIVLPDRLEDHRVVWAVEGARPVPLPSIWTAPPDVAPVNWTAYEIVSDDCAATSRNADDGLHRPRVRMADHSLRVEADGSYRGVVAWTLDPGGLNQLPIRLPADAAAVSCRILGRRVDLREGAAGSWLVPLASDRLPQVVEVLYQGRGAIGGAAPAAQLVDVPVSESVWTIAGPAAARGDASQVSLPAQALATYRAGAESLIGGVQSTGLRELPTTDSEEVRWFRGSLKLLGSARQGVWDAANGTEDRLDGGRTLAELEEAELAVSEFLKDRPSLAKEFANASAPSPPAGAAADDGKLAGDLIVRTHQLDGDVAPLLAQAAPFGVGTLTRGLTAAGLMLIAVCLARSTFGASVATVGQRWRFGGWMLFGSALWLWATPAMLGPAVIFCAGWFAWQTRNSWQRRREMAH